MAIGKAFAKAKEEQEARAGNPFAPTSSEREGQSSARAQRCEKVHHVCVHVCVRVCESKLTHAATTHPPRPLCPQCVAPPAVHGPLFKYQIHRRDLVAEKPIGAGQFGQVFRAMFKQKKVAVKTVRQTASAQDKGVSARVSINTHTHMYAHTHTHTHTHTLSLSLSLSPFPLACADEFMDEAIVMVELSHPSLVGILGVALQQKPWLCVIEYMEVGRILPSHPTPSHSDASQMPSAL